MSLNKFIYFFDSTYSDFTQIESLCLLLYLPLQMPPKIHELFDDKELYMQPQPENPRKTKRKHPCHELLQLSDESSDEFIDVVEISSDDDDNENDFPVIISEHDDDDDPDDISEFEEFTKLTEWGICVSHENKECMVCFEKTTVFSPSCCEQKQNICIVCIWNVIKEKIPKTTNLTKKSLEKHIFNDFSCCFCRKLTHLTIHVPSVYPNVFKELCRKVLQRKTTSKKPKTKKTPTPSYRTPSHRPRGRPPKHK